MGEVGTDQMLPINRGELDLTSRELISLGKELGGDSKWRFLALPNDEYIIKPKPIPKLRGIHHSSSINSCTSMPSMSIDQSHPLYELINNSHAAIAKSPHWLKKVHKILLVLCSNCNCNGFMSKIHANDPQFHEISSRVSPLKYITLQDVLEKLVNYGYESTSEALCDIYCVLICAFRLVDPGSEEWLKIHRISTLLSNLVVSENLKDNYMLNSDNQRNNCHRHANFHGYAKRTQGSDMGKNCENKHIYQEDFGKSQSELEFEQELLRIAANKKTAFEFIPSPPTPSPNVPPITYEERLEFQELLSTLPEECHLDLFTTFENTATWKNVGDEIELDDHATDPLVFRSLIQWARDRQLKM
ncbi:conserved Plasmodium protein, unknown function [Babesia microti strain RI]|uniref:Uncharacterized protein n=1 Tax=Babesia microti (strain RI) TaxID=1133968 RepID=A0A1R4ABB9_BABMR|nr:conserved Plasmodium protein, unknown function [Babesia microti strain RI]SJK86270.1 conserved Plasmodium protein, unknown function [Babesia microti strain RI]|eukprot:XP_012648752.2 conserved Plasmodium protein, unknown function [Babesia microti strain RI]